MNTEVLKELNRIRQYLEISKDEFKMLLLLAFKYNQEKGNNICEESLYEIVLEALNNMDYQSNNDGIMQSKTIQETFNRALDNLGYEKIKTLR